MRARSHRGQTVKPAMPAKALAVAVFGARGTGKTAWIKQRIAREKPARLMVWDFKHDPSLQDMGAPFRSLPAFISACREPRFSLRYMPDHGRDMDAQFDLFCQAAWMAGNVLVFVDEISEVTKANKAPAAWRRIVNVGREYQAGEGGKIKRVSIIAAGQRPAECDKSFIGNCDIVHTGRLGDFNDAAKMARTMGVEQRELMALPDLAWLEKRADSMEIFRGTLSFCNSKTAAKKTALGAVPKA